MNTIHIMNQFFKEKKNIVNQILSTGLEYQKNYKQEIFEKKKWFQFQFTFSILVMFVLILGGAFSWYYLKEKENVSNQLLANYHIAQLYNEPESAQENDDGIFGILEISKIELNYPVFSHLTEELLKISPCKFYGESPKQNGNICIAGHNYDNSLFFSKLSLLKNNDEIKLFDTNGKCFSYYVYDIYEVADSDLSPIFDYSQNSKILTLVTCNNLNNMRVIVKAIQR